MPKRTAADFARDAKVDDPYELELSDGKLIRPRPESWFTHDEQILLRDAHAAYVKAMKATDDGDALTKLERQQKTPFFVELQTRFGDDFKAFWAEAKSWSVASIGEMLNELDAHYNPTPADDTDADAGSEEGKAPLRSVGS